MPKGRFDPQVAQLIAGENIEATPSPDLVGTIRAAPNSRYRRHHLSTALNTIPADELSRREVLADELRRTVAGITYDSRPIHIVDPLEKVHEGQVLRSQQRFITDSSSETTTSQTLYVAHFMAATTERSHIGGDAGLAGCELYEGLFRRIPPLPTTPYVGRPAFDEALETWAMASTLLHAVVPAKEGKSPELLRVYGIGWRQRQLGHAEARTYLQGMSHMFSAR